MFTDADTDYPSAAATHHHPGQDTAQFLSSSCSSFPLTSSPSYRLSLLPESTTVPSAVSITPLSFVPVTITSTITANNMLDPLYGLATLSSWTPTFDPSTTIITTTTITDATPERHPSMLAGNPSSSSDCYWIRLFLKISILCGWFSERIRSYARLCQEACQEHSEERRLWASNPNHNTDSNEIPLHSSSVLKPLPKGSPTTFPNFRSLPAELRQQIWVEALPPSRILLLQLPKPSVSQGLLSKLGRHASPGQKSNIFTCSTPPPVLLSVCSESRAVALKRFRLGLAPRGHPQPRIYIDLANDVVGLSNDVMSSAAGKNLIRLTPDLRMVRHVCLAGGQAGTFMSTRQALVLDSVESVLVVENGLFGSGMVPRIAGLDWGYWVRWQCREGLARFGFGGELFGVREGGVSSRETWEGKGFGGGGVGGSE
ncbi:hypothetical protein QBC40DRAFT_343182 [Triangularia verruculosa]|uniref:2EXR domain-containing protein n=1 Tax=Triangularia verruculosa TaxID=2587418 RepID=A0AAN6X963_9PEZI|nr:hypothetical protein QBC40DRAFT_343182 [Triangularia verruculosa]